MREGETKIRVGGSTALPAYVTSRGGSASRALHDAGLVEADLGNPEGWLPLDRMATLYESAARELRDPHFGLAFGATVPLQSFGLLSYVVLNAADIQTAVDNLARYSGSLSVSGITAEVEVDGNLARLGFTLGSSNPDDSRQYFESIAAVLCVMMKALAGDQWRPREICFEHSPAGSRREVARRLQAKVRFGEQSHSIAFDAAYLGHVVTGADRSLLPIVEKHINEVVGRSESDPLVAKLREELARTLCDGKSELNSIARRLALSSRTLQRRMLAKGLRFKSILNETRTELAKEYLLQPGMSATEIAFLLGYTELSAFDRAFRRETGTSPTAWRSSFAATSKAAVPPPRARQAGRSNPVTRPPTNA